MTNVSDQARTAIVESIRAHLAASKGIFQAEHHVVPFRGETIPESEPHSPIEMFRGRLESVGGHCIVADDESAAGNALAAIVAGLHERKIVKRIALSDAPLVSVLAQNLAAEEITICPAPADLFNYDVGITTAQAAIAETGTLVLEAESEKHRLVSLLPPVHIAIVNSRDMCLTIGEALALLRGEKGKMSRAITFVTGPSRTADIELTLTVGVHGPKELFVIVIENH